MQAVVIKWFREKDFGFLENGSGPDILVRKADLLNCQFLKIGAMIEFECHQDKRGLTAKKVKLVHHSNKKENPNYRAKQSKPHYFGVMT